MKKLFISLMAVLFSAYVVAADSAIARITITGTTSGGSAQITLIENPSYSAGYDNGYDAPCNINLAEDIPKTLHIYSYIGANKYSTIATNNLDGLSVDFITNLLDDEYTMTFEVFTLAPGRTLDIYDLNENQRTDIDPSESYTFTATKGHNEIKDRFVINYVAPVASVTTNEDGWASFAYTADVAPADPSLAVYKGALNNSDMENPAIVLTAVTTGIPAGEGVFVHGEPLTTYYFSATTATAFSGNDLVGCTVATDPAGISDAIYTLRNVGGVTGLYNYVGTAAIPAGKAYLPIPVSGPNPAPAHVRMVINGAQGVENVAGEAVKAVKFVGEDGQIYVRRGEEVYNLQGQIVK